MAADSPIDEAYRARVNRVIDYVQQDVAREHRLEQLAAVANFSTFHFHRVFKALMGETVHAFVGRLRLQRAVHLMAHDPTRNLTDIALACGFSSSSAFSRSFKKHYGVPPRAFDLAALKQESRRSLNETVNLEFPRLAKGNNPDGFRADIRNLPSRRLAYRRVHGSYEPGVVEAAAHDMVLWAERNGFADGDWYGYTWEDPDLVPLPLCRYDVAVEIPADATIDDSVGALDLPEMTVAEVEVRGSLELEQRAIDWLFESWLPASGWLPANYPGFEFWNGRPYAHGYSYFELCLQLPVTRHPEDR